MSKGKPEVDDLYVMTKIRNLMEKLSAADAESVVNWFKGKFMSDQPAD